MGCVGIKQFRSLQEKRINQILQKIQLDPDLVYQYIYQYCQCIASLKTCNILQKLMTQFRGNSQKLQKSRPEMLNDSSLIDAERKENKIRLEVADYVMKEFVFINNWNSLLKETVENMKDIANEKLQKLTSKGGQIGKCLKLNGKIQIKSDIQYGDNTSDKAKSDVSDKCKVWQKIEIKEQQLKCQIQKNKQLMRKLQQNQDQLEKVRDQFNAIITQRIRENQEYQNQIKQLKVRLKEKDTVQQQDKQEIRNCKTQIQILLQKNKQQVQQYEKIYSQIKKRQEILKPINQSSNSSRYQLNSDILQDQKVDSILVNMFYESEVLRFKSLENQIKNRHYICNFFQQRKIRSTKLEFRFDQIQYNNFNNYIKGKENLLLLARTQSGAIIGGFTTKQFSSEHSNPDCFIFSLAENASPKLLKATTDKNCAIIQERYLIFGNSQIRIQATTQKAFSLVGGISAKYKSTLEPINYQQFILGKSNSFKLLCYEIYTLIFQ